MTLTLTEVEYSALCRQNPQNHDYKISLDDFKNLSERPIN